MGLKKRAWIIEFLKEITFLMILLLRLITYIHFKEPRQFLMAETHFIGEIPSGMHNLWVNLSIRRDFPIKYHYRECEYKSTNMCCPPINQKGIKECSECDVQHTENVLFILHQIAVNKNNSISSPSSWVENIVVDFVVIKQLGLNKSRYTLRRFIGKIYFLCVSNVTDFTSI